MLISGGVLPGILLVAPLARRLTMNGVLSLGRWVVLAGSAALIPASVPAWWGAAAAFGVGLGLIRFQIESRTCPGAILRGAHEKNTVLRR